MQEKLTVNPRYVPIYLKDDFKHHKNQPIKQLKSAFILTLILLIFVSLLITIYIFVIPSMNYASCVHFGCFDPHRAEVYSKIPEDNITIPKIEIREKNPKEILDFKLVCYYNFPSDESSNELQVADLDPNLCTHLNVGFATVENSTIVLSGQKGEILKKVVALRKLNGNLKILLSVGGSGAEGFGPMVRTHATRKTFIQSILHHVKLYKIDGVDLDWEFPNEVGIDNKERTHFSQLMYEIRKEIERQKKHRFLISLAVAAPYFVVLNSYDVGFISKLVDYVNLMSYDYHFYTKFTPFTGINSPLYSLPHDVGIFGTLNINYSANFWYSQGMPKEKIIIGLPTYGHTYRLINQHNNGISAPAVGYGETGSRGFADYAEACRFWRAARAVPRFDAASRSPYATAAREWVSFDDARSLTYKAEYARAGAFGGAMVYCLNADDHRGLCGAPPYGARTKFPLVQAIRDVLVNPRY